MKGPAVMLSDVDPGDVRAVLNRLSERLRRHGLTDGTLTALPRGKPVTEHSDGYRLIKCWMTLRGNRPPGWNGYGGHGYHNPVWQVTPEDLDAAAAELVPRLLDVRW